MMTQRAGHAERKEARERQGMCVHAWQTDVPVEQELTQRWEATVF